MLKKNWEQFLHCGMNKENLVRYYPDYICEHVYNPDYICEHVYKTMNTGQTTLIHFGMGDTVMRVTANCAVTEPRLQSKIEEADCRIILHAAVASDNCSKIVMVSPNTDVFVLLLHHRNFILTNELFMLTGKNGKYQNLTRYIPIHTIYDILTIIIQYTCIHS